MSALTTILFLGGGSPYLYLLEVSNSILDKIFLIEVFFSIKTLSITSFFIFVRAAFPRLRYDQLMILGWTIFIPFTMSFFIFVLMLKLLFSGFNVGLLTL